MGAFTSVGFIVTLVLLVLQITDQATYDTFTILLPTLIGLGLDVVITLLFGAAILRMIRKDRF